MGTGHGHFVLLLQWNRSRIVKTCSSLLCTFFVGNEPFSKTFIFYFFFGINYRDVFFCHIAELNKCSKRIMCVPAVTGMDNSSHKVKSSECACRKQRRQLEFRLGWEIISELVKVDASQKAESRGKGFYAPTKCQESMTEVICLRWPGISDERMGLARRRRK